MNKFWSISFIMLIIIIVSFSLFSYQNNSSYSQVYFGNNFEIQDYYDDEEMKEKEQNNYDKEENENDGKYFNYNNYNEYKDESYTYKENLDRTKNRKR